MYNTMLKLKQFQRIVKLNPEKAIAFTKGKTFVVNQYTFSPFTGKDVQFSSTRIEVVAILPNLFLKNDFNRLTPMSGELIQGIVTKTNELSVYETSFFIYTNNYRFHQRFL